jgi:hypothetical protein
VAIDLSFIHDLVAELYPQQRTTADRSNGDVTCSGPLGAPAVRSMSFLEPDLTDLVFDALSCAKTRAALQQDESRKTSLMRSSNGRWPKPVKHGAPYKLDAPDAKSNKNR